MSGELFALPMESRQATIASLEADLAELAFDAHANAIGPTESCRAPEVAVAVRLSILLRTYRGDYHTDSFDTPRLAARVRSGDELIWFWGERAQIALLRDAIARGAPPTEELDLGTVSVISAEDAYGGGHGELCRSGSMDVSLGGTAPILARSLAYLRGREPELSRRYHSLVLTPRTRRSTSLVRGGEAVHRIHMHKVRSRFWGFAPFYVMQGGVLEYLELRESNADPDAVRDATARDRPWRFVHERDRRFAEALTSISLGITPASRVEAPSTVPESERYALVLPHPSIAAHNYAIARPAPDGEFTLSAALDALAAAGVACATVQVALAGSASAGVQEKLLREGYRMTAIIPPKRAGSVCVATGIFARPNRTLSISPPFYLDAEPTSGPDAEVLSYLRDELLGVLHDAGSGDSNLEHVGSLTDE